MNELGKSLVSYPLHITFLVKDFFSKCDQICSKLRIWSNLLKKSLMKNFIFCAVIFTEIKMVPKDSYKQLVINICLGRLRCLSEGNTLFKVSNK